MLLLNVKEKKGKMREKLEGNEEEDGVGERLGKVIEMQRGIWRARATKRGRREIQRENGRL